MDAHLDRMKNAIDQVASLDADAWADLSSIWQPLDVERGEYLVEEGGIPRRLGFVVRGVVRAFYRTTEGEEYNKTFFTDGTFVCALAALLKGGPTYINLQALEDTRILVTDYSTFTDLYDVHQSIERLGRRVIEEEWVKKEHRELRLVLCSAEERYAYFQEEHPGLENRIAQYHIASFLGITPVALSRIRRRISERGDAERTAVP